MNDFYIYALFRPWNLQPCYIGKGRGDRFEYHAKQGVNHYNKHLSSIFKKANGADLPCVILHFGLDERTAFEYEKALIAAIGRADLGLGPLCNHTDGGDGCSGAVRSPETLERMRIAQMGKKASKEARQKMSKAAKGKIFTESHRENLSNSGKGRVPSREQRQKMSEIMTGRFSAEKNPMYGVPSPMTGKNHSIEVREKIRLSKIGANNPQYGKPRTEEQNEAHSLLLRQRGEARRKLMPPEERQRLEKKAEENRRYRLKQLELKRQQTTSLGLRDSPSSKQTVIVA